MEARASVCRRLLGGVIARLQASGAGEGGGMLWVHAYGGEGGGTTACLLCLP